MGLGQLDAVAAALIANGRAPETPAALIRAGTTTAQQTVTGRLDQLGELARQHRLEPPVLAVIGDVVALRERLGWSADAGSAALAAEIAALA
jgi:siroheme synthase